MLRCQGHLRLKYTFVGGKGRGKKCTFSCHRKKNREGPNNLNNTLQFSFVEHAKIDIFKELFRDVKQSRWSTNTGGSEEVAWQALSFSSNGYILDRHFSVLKEKKKLWRLLNLKQVIIAFSPLLELVNIPCYPAQINTDTRNL